MKRKSQLQRMVASSPFEAHVASALATITPVDATRREYRRDFELWMTFCREYNVDHAAPHEDAASAWVEWMKRQRHAPKTRSRRLSALSSIYRELRRKHVVPANPFSADEGPKREKKPAVQEPTPIAAPAAVLKLLGACGESETGRRDAAMIRVLWSTGMRRLSLASMTLERLQKDRAGYVATVEKKGGDTQRTLITGKAKVALDRWLAVLKDAGFTSGPIWRLKNGVPMSLREINRVLERRGKLCGEQVSPHMLRVSFLTYNPAGIEAKQDAAGHADPATTRLYDRDAWRGREAFEKMPEVEDVDD